MKTLDALDLQLNQLQNFVVQVLAADPANLEARLYYNSVSHTLRFYNGTAWTDLAAATYTDEQAQDAVAALLAAGSNTVVTVSYNDAGNSMTLGIGANQVTLGMIATQAANTVLANVTGGTAAPAAVTLAAFKTWLALVAADISNFDTQVRTNRLDQMAVPTADLNLGSRKLTSIADGVSASDAASVGQVTALVNTGTNKSSVRGASTANIAITALVNGLVHDGVTYVTGDRILLKNQTTGSENGPYTIGAAGTGVRSTDADLSAEVKGGLSVWVNEGTANADTRWVLTTNDPIVLGTTALTFTQDFAATATTAGAALTATGNVLDVVAGTTPASVAGPGGGLKANANDLVVDHTIVPLMFKSSLTGGPTSEVVTHNLGTRDVHVAVINNATPWDAVLVTWEATTVNTVTIRSGAANLPAGYRVVVMG